MKDISQLLDLVAQTIYDKKGVNIIGMDVRGISTMTDYVLIAEGNVGRHARALSQAVIDALEENGVRPLHVEGQKEGDWIVIDYGDVTVHLFIPELREKYALEKLWKEGKIVDVKITPHTKG